MKYTAFIFSTLLCLSSQHSFLDSLFARDPPLQQSIWEDEENERSDKCNPTGPEAGEAFDENDERCEGLPCEANYQCYSLNCNQALKCAPYESESRFNGVLALMGFAVSLTVIISIGVIKLCRNRITRDNLRERLAGAIYQRGNKDKRASR